MNGVVTASGETIEPFGRSLFERASERALSRVGVVDVGSNSIRMVVFDGAARSPAYFYNEKVMAGLGQGLATTGRLNPEGVVRGKHVWEKHSCINCHSLLGEGAYFAPELGNVWVRYGGREDPEGARAALVAWMQSQPSGIEGRRQMPQFNLTDQELNDLSDFLEWTSRINTQGWPPNDAG